MRPGFLALARALLVPTLVPADLIVSDRKRSPEEQRAEEVMNRAWNELLAPDESEEEAVLILCTIILTLAFVGLGLWLAWRRSERPPTLATPGALAPPETPT